MNEKYLDFLKFITVVNVKTEEEFNRLVDFCNSRGLTNIEYLAKHGFKSLHRNAGIQTIPYGELCIEFRISDGYFTGGARKPYEDYGCEVITVDELTM